MKITNKTVFTYEELPNFVVIAESFETRTGWGHLASLMCDGVQLGSSKINYYNRTWERYRYQSAILASIHNAIDAVEFDIFEGYKLSHNKKRISANQKAELLSGNSVIAKLKMLYDYYDKKYH